MAAAYLDESRAIGSEPGRYFATSRLEVDYRRPTPMDVIVELEADILARDERRYTLECRVNAAGKLCAVGCVEAVSVPSSWMGLDEPLSP